MMCLKMPVQVLRDDEPGPSTSLADVAELSRSGKDWRLVRNGKKGGAVQARSKRCHTSKLFYRYGQDFSLYLTIFLLF